MNICKCTPESLHNQGLIDDECDNFLGKEAAHTLTYALMAKDYECIMFASKCNNQETCIEDYNPEYYRSKFSVTGHCSYPNL